ncbi:MAG: type II secretion system F family protein [Candidatus Bathyarchaeota archaeon]|nr:type II secretion system F family protein [Candidatus Bathyarchaeum tardum]WGM90562.1 MAG: type II secretion system F family protein [Candidatus Bathyarchaeum tardum]WNZ29364.1 MAG: type II secretion system F family protein [Candidatus Bathyarchaeota archaeon]
MRKISSKIKKLTFALSVIVVLVILAWSAIFDGQIFSTYSNEIFLVSILILLIPSAILDYHHQKWIDGIENQMPLLVRGISESQETGLTIVKAFEKIADNKLISEPLASEVKKITVQMAWGTSFEDALINFKERVGSSIVNRFCALVLEASNAGGSIKKVFTATSGFMEEMNEMDRETSTQMKPYILVIYAAFGVFIITAAILVQSFFSPLEGFQSIMSDVAIGNTDQFADFFYKNMLVSAVFGGLMAGKLSTRRIIGGLKHGALLSVLGYAIFLVLIPPTWMVLA